MGHSISARVRIGSIGLAGIDATGTDDVTAGVQALIDSAPDGATIDFVGGTYRVEGGLKLNNRVGMTLRRATFIASYADPTGTIDPWAEVFGGQTVDATGSTTDVNGIPYSPGAPGTTTYPAWPYGTTYRDRVHLQLVNCSSTTLETVKVVGAAAKTSRLHPGGIVRTDPDGKVYENWGYRPNLDGQHGIVLNGCSNMLLTACSADDVFGDALVLGSSAAGGSTFITANNFAGSWASRYGLRVAHASDVSLDGTFRGARRSLVQVAPGATQVVDRTDIGPLTVGVYADNLVNITGVGDALGVTCHDFAAADPTQCDGAVFFDAGAGSATRPGPFVFRNITPNAAGTTARGPQPWGGPPATSGGRRARAVTFDNVGTGCAAGADQVTATVTDVTTLTVTGTAFTHNGFGQVFDMGDPAKNVPVSAGNITGGVATVSVPAGHGLAVGQYLATAVSNAAFNPANGAQLTAVTATTVSWAVSGPNVAQGALSGSVNPGKAVGYNQGWTPPVGAGYYDGFNQSGQPPSPSWSPTEVITAAGQKRRYGGSNFVSTGVVPVGIPPHPIGDGSAADRAILLAGRCGFAVATTGGHAYPTITVTNAAADSSVGSFRWALAQAKTAGGGYIVWAPGSYDTNFKVIAQNTNVLIPSNVTLNAWAANVTFRGFGVVDTTVFTRCGFYVGGNDNNDFTGYYSSTPVHDVIITGIRFDCNEGVQDSQGDVYANRFWARNVWVDHCYFANVDNATDGLCDSSGGANSVTFTWCHYNAHHKCSVCHSKNIVNSPTGTQCPPGVTLANPGPYDVVLDTMDNVEKVTVRVTYCNCLFSNNAQRMPLVDHIATFVHLASCWIRNIGAYNDGTNADNGLGGGGLFNFPIWQSGPEFAEVPNPGPSTGPGPPNVPVPGVFWANSGAGSKVQKGGSLLIESTTYTGWSASGQPTATTLAVQSADTTDRVTTVGCSYVAIPKGVTSKNPTTMFVPPYPALPAVPAAAVTASLQAGVDRRGDGYWSYAGTGGGGVGTGGATTALRVADSGHWWNTAVNPAAASAGGLDGNGHIAQSLAGQTWIGVLDARSADVTVALTTTTLHATADTGPCFRLTDGSNYWFFGNKTGRLVKRVAGSNTVVSTTTAGADGDVISVVLSGSSIFVRRNGTTVASAIDAFNVGATSHGFYFGNAPGAAVDDFSIIPGAGQLLGSAARSVTAAITAAGVRRANAGAAVAATAAITAAGSTSAAATGTLYGTSTGSVGNAAAIAQVSAQIIRVYGTGQNVTSIPMMASTAYGAGALTSAQITTLTNNLIAQPDTAATAGQQFIATHEITHKMTAAEAHALYTSVRQAVDNANAVRTHPIALNLCVDTFKLWTGAQIASNLDYTVMNGYVDAAMLALVDEVGFDCYGWNGTTGNPDLSSNNQFQAAHDYVVARSTQLGLSAPFRWGVPELGFCVDSSMSSPPAASVYPSDADALAIMNSLVTMQNGWPANERAFDICWFNNGSSPFDGHTNNVNFGDGTAPNMAEDYYHPLDVSYTKIGGGTSLGKRPPLPNAQARWQTLATS